MNNGTNENCHIIEESISELLLFQNSIL